MSENIKAEPYEMDVKEDSKFIGDAPFERCVDFMVRMMDKYGHEMEQDRNKIAS